MTLQSILEVDMEKDTFTTISWFNLNWNDPQLMWLYEEKFEKYKNGASLYIFRLYALQFFSPKHPAACVTGLVPGCGGLQWNISGTHNKDR